jgi:hypothetical protein
MCTVFCVQDAVNLDGPDAVAYDHGGRHVS